MRQNLNHVRPSCGLDPIVMSRVLMFAGLRFKSAKGFNECVADSKVMLLPLLLPALQSLVIMSQDSFRENLNTSDNKNKTLLLMNVTSNV